MRIIAKRTLREFWERHPDAREPLDRWHRMARRADWTTPEQTRQDWPRTSILGSDRAVFRIKGNDYRLVVAVDYPHGMVFIRFIGTHAEYDRIDAEEV